MEETLRGAMAGVTWIPWIESQNFLAKYKKDCTFCVLPATAAACHSSGNTSAVIRCCDDLRCRTLAIKLALGATGSKEES
jgi:hypothetical protein